jgi:putative GTP pyrophosphokinase
MRQPKKLNPEELKDRAIRFYSRYKDEAEQITQLLAIHLNQLALAYTIDNKLPKEAVTVTTRMKSLESFLKKLKRKGYPQFYYPTEVCADLIGARVTCWFLDDCYGMLEYINSSKQVKVREKTIEDYIKSPKVSGYRSIHLLADVTYDSVVKDSKGKIQVEQEDIISEIQIRTKLQDAWGEYTHEFHYKSKDDLQGENGNYEILVAEMANRIASEDRSTVALRKLYQNMKVDEKIELGIREGIKDEN